MQEISNPPNHEQEVSRILTPLEGKRTPLVKYFVDNMGISKGCLRTCVFKTHTRLHHHISEKQWDRIRPYLSRRKSAPRDDTKVVRSRYKFKGTNGF